MAIARLLHPPIAMVFCAMVGDHKAVEDMDEECLWIVGFVKDGKDTEKGNLHNSNLWRAKED
jgi:hypothetical protein